MYFSIQFTFIYELDVLNKTVSSDDNFYLILKGSLWVCASDYVSVCASVCASVTNFLTCYKMANNG